MLTALAQLQEVPTGTSNAFKLFTFVVQVFVFPRIPTLKSNTRTTEPGAVHEP